MAVKSFTRSLNLGLLSGSIIQPESQTEKSKMSISIHHITEPVDLLDQIKPENQPLTFDHDHVDVDGADERLGETLSSL